MSGTSVKGDTAVAQRTTREQPPAARQLCACCKLHPVATTSHPTTVATDRLRRFARDINAAAAHVAGVGIAIADEVEDWKALAAAETDEQRAENFRKSAAVSRAMVPMLEVIAQDVKAVTEP